METNAETHSCRFFRPRAAFEQHAHEVLPITDPTLILDRGHVVHRSTTVSVLVDATPLERFLDVTGR